MEELVYFFGRIKLKVKKINKFFFINGIIGSLIFYYFVRKIQTYYEVDISIDGYGLAGAVWYGVGLGFVFGVKFIRIQEIINYCGCATTSLYRGSMYDLFLLDACPAFCGLSPNRSGFSQLHDH